MRKRDELADPNSCLNKAGDDEMLFVLRGRDDAYAGTVRFWQRERVKLGLNRPGDAKLVSAERDVVAVLVERGMPGAFARPNVCLDLTPAEADCLWGLVAGDAGRANVGPLAGHIMEKLAELLPPGEPAKEVAP